MRPAQLSLQAGSAGQLSAQANDATGQPVGGASFRFTASDPKVLQVSDQGLVTALGPASTRTQIIVASGAAQLHVQVAVQPGPPQRMDKISGDGQHLRAGDAPAQPLIVRVTDAWNNPLAGIPVLFEPAPDLWPPSGVLTEADGTAKIALPAVSRIGAAIVALQVKGMPSLTVTFALQVTPGAPVKITRIAAAPQRPGADDIPAIALLVTDKFNNPIPDVALTARVAKTDWSPQLPQTDATGISRLTLPILPRARRLTMQVALATDSAVQTSFSVDLPGNADQKHSRAKK